MRTAPSRSPPQLAPDPIHPAVDADEHADAAEKCRNHKCWIGVAERPLLQIDVMGDSAGRLEHDEGAKRQTDSTRVDEAPAQVQEGVGKDEPEHIGKRAYPGGAPQEVDHGGDENDLRRQHAVVRQLNSSYAPQQRDDPPVA